MIREVTGGASGPNQNQETKRNSLSPYRRLKGKDEHDRTTDMGVVHIKHFVTFLTLHSHQRNGFPLYIPPPVLKSVAREAVPRGTEKIGESEWLHFVAWIHIANIHRINTDVTSAIAPAKPVI